MPQISAGSVLKK